MSKIIDNYILFDNGTYKEIKKDSSGHEYYEVDNKYSSNKRFDFEIIRALDYVDTDDGDELCFNGTNITVRRYLDRNFGEAVRNNTLKAMKDLPVQYVLLFDDGFMGDYREFVQGYTGLMTFDNSQDAKVYIDVLARKVAAEHDAYKELGEKEQEIFLSTFNQDSFEYHVLVDVIKNELALETILRKIKIVKYK